MDIHKLCDEEEEITTVLYSWFTLWSLTPKPETLSTSKNRRVPPCWRLLPVDSLHISGGNAKL